MNKVYQHGDELFVTFDATPRMRNLRTGLTLRPRSDFEKHFKYLGDMPQVGQVWEAKRSGRVKHILGVEGASVRIRIPEGLEGTVPVAVFIKNHTLQSGPNYIFATGDKDAIKASAQDRRFTAAEVGTAAHKEFEEYMMKDVEAEAELRNSVGLYMAPDGKVFRACGTSNGRVGLAIGRNSQVTHLVDEDHFRKFYKALPIPGQLWAKGPRYVTVDRVEDGRVYYTDGSSGLRRFLNEYAYINPQLAAYLNVGGTHYEDIKPSQFGTPDTLVLDFANLGKVNNDPLLTGLKAAYEYGGTVYVGPRPFITAKSFQGKLEELARGYKFGKQGFKVFGTKFGRMLRPAPTTESMPCPLNVSTLNRLNTGNALDNWTQYRNTLGAKIRYVNQRIKELSK